MKFFVVLGAVIQAVLSIAAIGYVPYLTDDPIEASVFSVHSALMALVAVVAIVLLLSRKWNALFWLLLISAIYSGLDIIYRGVSGQGLGTVFMMALVYLWQFPVLIWRSSCAAKNPEEKRAGPTGLALSHV